MSNYTPPLDPLADLGAIGSRTCACVPNTAGELVHDQRCPVHGTPPVTITFADAPPSQDDRYHELYQLVKTFAEIDWMSQDGRIHQIAQRYRKIDPQLWLTLLAERRGLQERVKFTADYETLRLRLATPVTQEPCARCEGSGRDTYVDPHSPSGYTERPCSACRGTGKTS